MLKEKVAVIRLDERNLWTVDLYLEGVYQKNIGGSYPKSRHCEIDANQTWGKSVPVYTTTLRSTNAVEVWLNERLEVASDDKRRVLPKIT